MRLMLQYSSSPHQPSYLITVRAMYTKLKQLKDIHFLVSGDPL